MKIYESDFLRKQRRELREILNSLDSRISEISGGKIRILFVAPHLSTGGMPQYLLKKIEIFNSESEVYCLQWENNAPIYDVQRLRIKQLLGDRFFCLDGEKEEFFKILSEVNPDVLHFEDIPERFIPYDFLERIYKKSRDYFICETPHSSTTEPDEKIFLPDKFIMVNEWMVRKYSVLKSDFGILEYPIEDQEKYDQGEYMDLLGFDRDKKHVINVGLFTPGKNQGELIEIARSLKDYPIQFHFIGNQASNFINYWGPIMKNLPGNCKIWGERRDTENFYKAADLFYFSSKWELNPIVIKESLSFRLPIMMRRLDPYLDSYDNNQLVTYLSEDPYSNREFLLKNLRIKNEIL